MSVIRGTWLSSPWESFLKALFVLVKGAVCWWSSYLITHIQTPYLGGDLAVILIFILMCYSTTSERRGGSFDDPSALPDWVFYPCTVLMFSVYPNVNWGSVCVWVCEWYRVKIVLPEWQWGKQLMGQRDKTAGKDSEWVRRPIIALRLKRPCRCNVYLCILKVSG